MSYTLRNIIAISLCAAIYACAADNEKRGETKYSTNKVLIDEYGLTSPAEFFAVATESFFEKAMAMQKRLPHLYEQLKKFYSVDPASWK